MNPTDLPPDEGKRLNLDLPQSRHDKLDEMIRFLGYPSKNEATKKCIDLVYDHMQFALEGSVPASQHLETKETTAILGTELTTLARRALAQKAKQSPPPS